MAVIGVISGSSGSGRYVNPKPSITYNTSPGVFNINNADATANYSSNSSVNTGSLSFGSGNSTVTLSAADSIATVTNKSVKGVSNAPQTIVERKTKTYTPVTAPPPNCCPPCYNYQPAGGTRYGDTWMAFYGSPYTYLNPAPGYVEAPNEWYKIT